MRNIKWIDWKSVFFALFFPLCVLYAQDENFQANEANEDALYDIEILAPLNDPSAEGQRIFVEELLDIAGYVPERITIHQTLSKVSRLFRVRLDSVNSGLVFVRWNPEKKENYIANKRINPDLYYNLNTARTVYRQQTNKASFSIEDVALQAPDQKPITPEMLKQYRLEKQQMDLEMQMKKPKKKSKSKN